MAIIKGLESPTGGWGEVHRNDCSADIIAEVSEERFGFWLKTYEQNIVDPDNYMRLFEQFEAIMRNDASNGRLVGNPFYYVISGKEYLNQKQFDKAENQFTKAIGMDLRFAANGFYNRAFALIANYGKSSETSKIDQAISDFKQARKILQKRKDDLHIIQMASKGNESSELFNQVNRKVHLLEIQVSAINRAIGYDHESLRRDINELNKHKSDMQAHIDNFVSLEMIQSDLDQAKTMYMALYKIEQQFPNQELKEYLKVWKKKCDEFEYRTLSFQPSEMLLENIKHIDSSIEQNETNLKETGVLTGAKERNHSVKIELTYLEDILQADKDTYKDDLYEFERNGYLGSFKITEISPISWWSVIGVLLIGIVQIVAGAAIAVFSFGAAASFGVGMIMEGVSDVVTAVVDGIINRNFSWKNWTIMKAISYTVSIVCAGLGALKNMVKTAYSAVKGVVTQGTKVFIATVIKGWKLAAKKIARYAFR